MPLNIGETCKEGETSMTKKQLQELKEEIRNFKIPDDPEKYNVKWTKLEKNDTVSSILKKIFSNENVPKTVIDRIELSMSANNVDLQKLRTDFRVYAWQVDKGVLIFTTENRQEVFRISVLPWSVLRSPEKKEEEIHNYDLGKYTGSPAMKKEPDLIEGSVDFTAHTNTLKTKKWYSEKAAAAKALLEWYAAKPAAFDAATVSLINTNKTILQDLASQTVFDPAYFHQQFETKYSSDEVYGGNGVYNVVLAFQRVLDKIDPSGSYSVKLITGSHIAHKFDANGFDEKGHTREEAGMDEEKNIVISLRIGGKTNSLDDRYVKTTKIEAPKDVPPVICPPPKPEDKPPKPPEPEEKPVDPREIEDGLGKLFSSTATLKAGLLGREQEMTAPTMNNGGKTYKTFFVLPGGNRINPAKYIAYSQADKYTVYVGEMEYDFGVITSSAKPGKILKTITLDSSSPAATRRSYQDIPNQL